MNSIFHLTDPGFIPQGRKEGGREGRRTVGKGEKEMNGQPSNTLITHPRNNVTSSACNVDNLQVVSICHVPLVSDLLQGLGVV